MRSASIREGATVGALKLGLKGKRKFVLLKLGAACGGILIVAGPAVLKMGTAHPQNIDLSKTCYNTNDVQRSVGLSGGEGFC